MSIIASAKSTTKYPPIGEGIHPATCIGIYDIGLQTTKWQGREKVARKIIITWELHDETVEVDGEEKPRYYSNTYSLSLNEKSSLRKDLETWRGKRFTDSELEAFDLYNVLGKPCQIQILHTEKDGRIYANSESIIAWPKGVPNPGVQGELVYFDLNPDNPEDFSCLNMLDTLPEWIQEKVRQSPTYAALESRYGSGDDFDELEAGGGEDMEPQLPWNTRQE